jgi:peptide/nickel transport system permease protein
VAPLASVLMTFLLLGLLGWAGPARIVAGAARSLRHQDFILLARAAGCSRARLLLRHLLPNLRPVLAAQFWISVPLFILSEASLGMLGLGIGEPLPSWGGLLRQLENYPAVQANPWLLAPLVLLILVVGCFHVLVPGEGDFS